uniref:Si:dkeyp-72e1.6 n=1 Tax=Hucho hucho TaxID=62062 RepID=A0A4W5RN72_9TELE
MAPFHNACHPCPTSFTVLIWLLSCQYPVYPALPHLSTATTPLLSLCCALCSSSPPTYRGLGRCSCAFWLAVSFDIFGLLVLLIGVFADIFFYDFLIYAGAIIIFLSLIWWVFWYTGNIEVPPEELEDDVGLLKKERGIAGAVRRLSSRLSNGVRNSLRRNGAPPRGVARRVGTGLSTTHMRDAQKS